MKRGFCAFLVPALLVSATALHAATVTTKYSLTNSAWTDLGPGPLLVGFNGAGVFAISDTTPTLVNEGFGVRPGRAAPIKATSHVWATATGLASVDVYAAPISGGGGGGGGGSTWNAADATANGFTLSNGGLTVTPSGTVWGTIRNTSGHSSGKFYVEFATSATAGSNVAFGIADASFIPTIYLSGDGGSSGGAFNNGSQAGSNGIAFNYGMTGATFSSGDVVGIAVDFTAGSLWLARNNVWQSPGNPATGASPMATIGAPAFGLSLFAAMAFDPPVVGVWTLQPTSASQKYAAPAGFSPWN